MWTCTSTLIYTSSNIDNIHADVDVDTDRDIDDDVDVDADCEVDVAINVDVEVVFLRNLISLPKPGISVKKPEFGENFWKSLWFCENKIQFVAKFSDFCENLAENVLSMLHTVYSDKTLLSKTE